MNWRLIKIMEQKRTWSDRDDILGFYLDEELIAAISCPTDKEYNFLTESWEDGISSATLKMEIRRIHDSRLAN